jgi:hypothetical protein
MFMSASYLGSPSLQSIVLCTGAVIFGEYTNARASSLTERYILERLWSGESLGRSAQRLLVLEHLRAVDEFASSLSEHRSTHLKRGTLASRIFDVVMSMGEL